MVCSACSASSASAVWTQEGAPLEETVELSLDGSWGGNLAAAGYGWQCDKVTGDLILEAETDSADLSNLSFAKCYGRGALSGLLLDVIPAELPWALESKGGVLNSLGTYNFTIVYKNAFNEPIGKSSSCSMDWTLTPDNQGAISEFVGSHNSECEGQPFASSSQFSVSPAGSYGWE